MREYESRTAGQGVGWGSGPLRTWGSRQAVQVTSLSQPSVAGRAVLVPGPALPLARHTTSPATSVYLPVEPREGMGREDEHSTWHFKASPTSHLAVTFPMAACLNIK